MYFILERIQRFCDDLKECIVTNREEVRKMQVRYGEIPKKTAMGMVSDGFRDFESGSIWSEAGTNQYALFRFKVGIPREMDGKRVLLNVRTNKEGWNALNPQMLAYVNGRERQGLDTNHMEVLLEKEAKAGDEYEIMLYAFSGLKRSYNYPGGENDVKLFVWLIAVDPVIEALYFDLKAPLQYVAVLPENGMDRVRLLDTLNETVNLIDLRVPYSSGFYSSLTKASGYLRENLYEKPFGGEIMATCVGHTHIDVGWLWRYCHTRDKTVRSFTTVLRLMEQYPEYVFMSSQPQLYEYIKEDYPGIFEEIRERVKEGRWEPEGGMWVEADTNVPSGESLVRQLLFGKRFFEKEFGIESRILWLPDVFGYSAALPQILKKSGIDYFMTAKLWNNEINRFPYDTLLWKGIDGTEILTHLLTYCPIAYNSLIEKGDIAVAWNNYKQKEINRDILVTFGYGDGGGGPTKEMLESLRRLEKGLPGVPGVKLGTSLSYFKQLEERVSGHKRLPRWVGELYYELHRGTYTTMARNKRYNRKSEILYTGAEWISSLSRALLGAPYPQEELNKGWKDVLLNQFHDVLPGSSIKEVYDDTDAMYEKVLDTGERIVAGHLDKICGAVASKGPSLVVFNPLSWDRDGIVEFKLPGASSDLQLLDAKGDRIPCQETAAGDGSFVAFVTSVASKGYSSYRITEEKGAAGSEAFTVSRELLENRFFRITLAPDGSFSSIYDKAAGREILPEGGRGNVLQAFEDKPRKEDNWNLDIFYTEKMWEIDAMDSILAIEQGPVRGILRITRSFLNSQVIQDVMIYRDIPRVDFKTRIDWKERDIVIKAAFPVDANTDKATYEIQFGHVVRNTHWNTSWDIAKFEVCGHKWADISEDGFGVSLLNDSKYGYDIKDGCMRLTLLRSGTQPNPYADKEVHEFTYSLFPHRGGWREAGTVRQAYDLNYPLLPRRIGKQEGSLPHSLSMVRIDKENVILEVVKKAEDGDETVIRLYEAFNRRSGVRLRFMKKIKTIAECNLMEKELEGGAADCRGCEAVFEIKPLEIKTFKIVWDEEDVNVEG